MRGEGVGDRPGFLVWGLVRLFFFFFFFFFLPPLRIHWLGVNRSPARQSEFFERAAEPLTKRETILALAAIGGTLSTLVWG